MMSKKVFKYRLTPKTEVEMPVGAEILCLDTQHGVPTIWALVDPDPEAATETRKFDVVGTGCDVAEKAVYVGTYFDRESSCLFPNGFVWHVFEV